MAITGPYREEALRLREEITKRFKTQVALCKAIGASDSSYMTAYVTGKNRIGNILREKLEAVGIDVAYVLYGKKGISPVPIGPDPEVIATLQDCRQRLQTLQNSVIDLNKELISITRLIDKATKKLNL
ncbi:MAG: transcriptional regulator [Chlorobiaceae bacterium]|jgi:hypothetical protein|nr:transcriptional regulator [Chlorobiaceae bacterium]